MSLRRSGCDNVRRWKSARPPSPARSTRERRSGCAAQVAACVAENPEPEAKERFIGAVVPHAGSDVQRPRRRGVLCGGRTAAALHHPLPEPHRLRPLRRHQSRGRVAHAARQRADRHAARRCADAAVAAPRRRLARARARAFARSPAPVPPAAPRRFHLRPDLPRRATATTTARRSATPSPTSSPRPASRSASWPAPISITTKIRRRRCARTSWRSMQVLKLDPRELWRVVERVRHLHVRLHPHDDDAHRREATRRETTQG